MLTGRVPVAIEVFDGNTADPKTLTAQIDKLKTRFGLSNIALVGDRGMLTSARIRDELRRRPWIGSARCAPRRSRPWSRTGRCSCRCSMSKTCSSSPIPTIRASGWCAATTPPGRGARPQTRRTFGGHRNRAADHRRGHPPPETTLTRARQDRPAGGQGMQQVQDGQTL
ncbi:putative transposase [Mycobacterium xenopi 4042]|uniref:Putative transposase n=1 Tax=Mycobacterium xenopi 4042 TaxID=1299334 RepID=X8DZ26_MYCXE|nr:putative transposase [Mycobacterium xenopi 4042]